MTTVRRVLQNDLLNILSEDHTRPLFVCQMHFPSGTQYLSEGPSVSFNGDTYIEGAIQVGTFRWTPSGRQRGTVAINNELSSASALVLSDIVDEVAVDIYALYLDANDNPTTAEQIVAGVMTGFNLTPQNATINVVTSRQDTEIVPNRYYTEVEGFTNLPPEGTVIHWNSNQFVLEAED